MNNYDAVKEMLEGVIAGMQASNDLPTPKLYEESNLVGKILILIDEGETWYYFNKDHKLIAVRVYAD